MDGIPRLSETPVLKGQVRRVLRNCGFIDPTQIEHYVAQGGYAGLAKAIAIAPEQIIEEVKRAGLRGRGGAGFPTWRKWQFCRQAQGQPIPGRPGPAPKYLICNADEGDPGAFMNRSLIEGDPHALSGRDAHCRAGHRRRNRLHLLPGGISAGAGASAPGPGPGRTARTARGRHPRLGIQLPHQGQGRGGGFCLRRGDRADCLHRGQTRHAPSAPAVSRRVGPVGQTDDHQQRRDPGLRRPDPAERRRVVCPVRHRVEQGDKDVCAWWAR